MLTVEKIGGSSMSKFQDVYKNIIHINGDVVYGRIFVVSAYDNVTNWLLEHKKSKAPGIYQFFINNEPYETELDKLLDRLMEINNTFTDLKLDPLASRQYLSDRVGQTKNYLRSMAEGIASG